MRYSNIAMFYAPVVNGTTLRTLLAVAAINDWEIDQMDAVTAFLNAPMGMKSYTCECLRALHESLAQYCA